MKHSVREFMTELPHTVGKSLPLDTAEEMMSKFSCHHLPVLEGGHLVGVISDRDLALVRLSSKGAKAKVADAMTEEPLVVDPEMSVKQAAQTMLEHKVGSVIVRAKEGRPWGIFTTSDALRVIVALT